MQRLASRILSLPQWTSLQSRYKGHSKSWARQFCTTRAVHQKKEILAAQQETEILFKMEYSNFDGVTKYLNSYTGGRNKLNLDFYNKVLTKAIQKDNIALAFEIFDSTRHLITPDDTTYVTLIEALLSKAKVTEAYTLFFQSYLNGKILDLLVVERLLSSARRLKLDVSYIAMLYELARFQFPVLTKPLMLKFVVAAAKLPNSSELFSQLMEDITKHKYNILNKDSEKDKNKKSSSRREREEFEEEREPLLPTNDRDQENEKEPPPRFSIKRNKKALTVSSKKLTKYILVDAGHFRSLDDAADGAAVYEDEELISDEEEYTESDDEESDDVSNNGNNNRSRGGGNSVTRS